MPESSPDFRKKQAEFVAYIKDPSNNPLPEGAKYQRMDMYRELIFNNIVGFLSSNFPVLKKILAPAAWLALVQDFFVKHSCQTPYFAEIAEEFLDYLQHERKPKTGYPVFMLELAHYEWVEMALFIASIPAQKSANIADFLSDPNAFTVDLSPLAWPLVYQYPVHLIAPYFQPSEPTAKATFLVVYRNAKFEVKFMQLNAIVYRLLTTLQDSVVIDVSACLKAIAEEFSLPPASVVVGGITMIKNLATKEIIIFSPK